MKAAVFLVTVLLIAWTLPADSQKPKRGILNQKAPFWGVSQWHQLPAELGTLDVGAFKGKTIYLYCFQSWCPGCHSSGFPTLQTVIGHYKDDPKVAFVAVQTSFEGFGSNTFARAKETAERYNLDIPIGQSGSRDTPSVLMRNYRTGGTPWTIIIDKHGIVRYNDFHIKAQDAIRLIDGIK